MNQAAAKPAELPEAKEVLSAMLLAARIDQHVEAGWQKPDQAALREQLARQIADLESDQVPVRQKAREELEKWGELAIPALRARLAEKPTLAVQHQIAQLLAKTKAAAGDAELFRRLSLDLNGRIPSITRIVDYLDDHTENKQRAWAATLIRGPDHVELYRNHWTNYWRNALLPHASAARGVAMRFHRWLHHHLREHTPFDQLVRDFLTGPMVWDLGRAYEEKPENLAHVVARVFLGLKREWPAHDDAGSAGNWMRRQSWEFAAFFAAGAKDGKGPAEITLPDQSVVQARFPNGGDPKLKKGDDALAVLAEWLTRRGNPYFARNAVNRLWAWFFGIGLVEPVDAGGPDNPPSHSELLDELAQQLVAHQFDLEYLLLAITGSDAYQRTSVQTAASHDDPRRFARSAVRGLTAEQLWDSLVEATGNGDDAFRPSPPRDEFMAAFGGGFPTTAVSVPQALQLMNGKAMANTVGKSRSLETIADANAAVPMERRIQELYLITLSRRPRPTELEKLIQYVDRGPAKNPNQTLADIFWALLNSSEFRLNH